MANKEAREMKINPIGSEDDDNTTTRPTTTRYPKT